MRHFHLDRIISLEKGVGALGVRAVALSDDAFTEHFPGNPVLPGVFLLEGMAQTAGLLLWESSDHSRIAVMVSVERARFPAFARPGDTVHFAMVIDSWDDRAARVRGTAMVADRQVAAAGFTFSMQPSEAVIPPLYLPYWQQTADVWLGRYPGTSGPAAPDA